MASRTCVGCDVSLTNDIISREHILPRWLAEELRLPGVKYKHYRHDEDKAEDELVRSHDLDSLAIKNVCSRCNSGWMSRLEARGKPTLLDLLNMKTTLLQLTPDDRATVSAWAIKTAFMIASAQQHITDLPWPYFKGLAEDPERIPTECPVVATQLNFLEGFLHACPTDTNPRDGQLNQVRVGFSIRHLHFVVIIPILKGERVVRTSGVHIPLWPLDAEIRVRYATFPTLTSPRELVNYLVDLVDAGIATQLSVDSTT